MQPYAPRLQPYARTLSLCVTPGTGATASSHYSSRHSQRRARRRTCTRLCYNPAQPRTRPYTHPPPLRLRAQALTSTRTPFQVQDRLRRASRPHRAHRQRSRRGEDAAGQLIGAGAMPQQCGTPHQGPLACAHHPACDTCPAHVASYRTLGMLWMWGFGHRVGVVAVPHVSPGRLCGVIVERCVFCLCVSTLPLICVSWLHVSMTIHSFYIRANFGPTVHCVVITPQRPSFHIHIGGQPGC